MAKNYYQILNIKKDSAEQEIAQAYKKLALRWHPKFSKQDQNTSFYHFCEISQAYEVLSDSNKLIYLAVKRAFYDKYGEQKLKSGFFSQGQLKGGYRFAKNPDQIYQKFFHNNNTFAQVVDKQLNTHGSIFSHAFGAQNYQQIKNLKNLQVVIACTLNELYNGCSKLVTYTKTKLNLDGKTTSNINQNKLIEIKRGYDKNTLIKFEKQGHQAIDGTITDLIFKIKQIQHPKFKRLHNDLLYTAQISLKHALNSQSLEVITLDGRKLLVSFDQIINLHTVKQVTGEGMPIQHKGNVKMEEYGKQQKKGNLYIKFDIHFPNHLSQQQKSKLKRIL